MMIPQVIPDSVRFPVVWAFGLAGTGWLTSSAFSMNASA